MIDLSNLQIALSFLATHGYLILFILILLEGPLVTMLAAFAASQGIMNVYFVFLISTFGNIISDIIVFYVGLSGGRFLINRFKSVDPQRRSKISHLLHNHPGKTLTVIKIVPGIPVPGILIAGASHLPFSVFFAYSATITSLFSLLLTLIGFYSGVAFGTLFQHFFSVQIFIALAVIFLILIWVTIRKILAQMANKIEKI